MFIMIPFLYFYVTTNNIAMPATNISNSQYISSLDLLVYGNTCNGLFYLDLSPSIFINAGNLYVLGANFQIINPQGVIVKPFGSNYEIAPSLSGGMNAAVTFAIPTISGGYQLGKYICEVELFDANGTRYTNTKSITICAPNQSKPTEKFGLLSAKLIGNCQDGKMSVIVDTPPNYQGVVVTTQTNDFTLLYPTASGVAPLTSTYGNFSTTLYEGVYMLSGTICAVYNLGDSVYVSIFYKVKKEHNQRCLIDLCCINDAFNSLRAKRASDCSEKEKNETASIIVDALFLLEDAKLAAGCGEDPSDIISELEALLGCKCTCNCNEGTPIINNTPVADASIVGCGFTSERIGLTTVYHLDNYQYVVSVNDNGGVLVISDATLNGCTQTQLLTFSVDKLYASIKTLATADACAWAAIVRRCLVGIDLTCLGYTAAQVAAMTLQQLFQALASAACNGGSCSAKVTNIRTEQVGRFLNIKWDEDAFTASVDVFIDGLLVGSVMAGILTFDFPIDAQTSVVVSVIPRCLNGSQGAGATVTVSLLRPAFVAPPSIYSPFLQNPCPYDITTNVQPLPLGVTAEFHRLNNTDPLSLVSDPTNALQGVYFVFGKDNIGNYSEGVQMQLVCDSSGSCSAPQNLQVAPQVGGNLVKFQSAAYPPPMNSYTVKRRLKSDADIDGNYTTIGSPVWNASISRWVISDNSAVENELYVYRAISNCDSTFPYVDVDYASLVCPEITLTSKVTEIDYSMIPVGGGVTKYEVTIYSDNGVTPVHTDTHVPGFSNPTNGKFFYLTQDKVYYVGVKVFIGTYSKTCTLRVVRTLKSEVTLTLDYIAGTFTANIDSPLAVQLIVLSGSMSVTGSQDICVTPFETDTNNPNIIIPIGSLGASQLRNGLSYLSVYYKIDNTVTLGDVGAHVDGDVVVLGGANVTIKINHITCGFYPA